MAKKKPKTNVIVKVADEHLDRVAEVADRLRAAGMDVGEALEAIGTITGTVEASKVNSLTGITGVAAVEPAADYQLPPPDAPVQ